MDIGGHPLRWCHCGASGGTLLLYFPHGKGHPTPRWGLSCVMVASLVRGSRTGRDFLCHPSRTTTGADWPYWRPLFQRTKCYFFFLPPTTWERRRRSMRVTVRRDSFVFIVGGSGRWRRRTKERGWRKEGDAGKGWEWTARLPRFIDGGRNKERAGRTGAASMTRTSSSLLPLTPWIFFHR